MGKETDELNAINQLLLEQNNLLRKQNELLRQASEIKNRQDDECIDFIKNIDRDEMRSGFLVTSQRKKLWNVEIGLLKEFDRICKKHDLRWFAICGTLLGAVRHGGFVPWDDDVDITMLRPDYEKFQRIAVEELQPPYFSDVWCNYRLESEGASLAAVEGDFQFMTQRMQRAGYAWFTQWPSIRLRDSRTTMLEFPARNFINQGIWIDIFPLDPLPPFKTDEQNLFFEKGKLLLLTAAIPSRVKKFMADKKELPIAYDELNKILDKPYCERGKIFDDFMAENFFMSEHVGDIRDHGVLTNGRKFYQSKDFNDVVYLPFERIKILAPAGYESVLTDFYGDWRKPVFRGGHAATFSVDIPCKEYFQKTTFK